MFNINEPENQFQPPDGTILLCYRGSVAHNMYVPPEDDRSIDDIDLMGCVVPPVENYFGLSEWGTRGTKEVKRGKYDVVLYEARKLVSLLLQGNPNVLACLWTHRQHVIRVHSCILPLFENRSMFAGKHVYKPFAGYAAAQLHKMETRDPAELREYIGVTEELKRRGAHPNHRGEEFDIPVDDPQYGGWSTEKLIHRLRSYQKKGENIGYMGEKRKRLVLENGYDSKNAAHLIRLLRMCVEFLREGEMQVYRVADRDELLAIKRGEWKLDDVKQHAEELFAAAKAARDSSPLPVGPDRSGVERMLVALLRERLTIRYEVGES